MGRKRGQDMTTTAYRTGRRASALVATALVLAGCTAAPAGLGGLFGPATPPAPTLSVDTGADAAQDAAQGMESDVAAAPPPPGDVPTASRAEQACVGQARSQGLDVRQVVGSRAVTGSDGSAIGRDVMLQVARSGQVYEVRCSYTSDIDTARIMLL